MPSDEEKTAGDGASQISYQVDHTPAGIFLVEVRSSEKTQIFELPPVETKYDLVFSIIDALVSRSLHHEFDWKAPDFVTQCLKRAFVCLVPKTEPITEEHKKDLPTNTNDFVTEHFDICKCFLDADKSHGVTFKNKLEFLGISDNCYYNLTYASDDSDTPSEISDDEPGLNEHQRCAGITKFDRFFGSKSKKTPEMPSKTFSLDFLFSEETSEARQKIKEDEDFFNEAFSSITLDKPRADLAEDGALLKNEKRATQTHFLVPGFRGINYMASRFSKEARQTWRRKDLQEKKTRAGVFSEAILQTRVDFYRDVDKIPEIFDQEAALYQSLVENAEALETSLSALKENSLVLAVGLSGGKYIRLFGNLLHAIQHVYTNGIIKAQRYLRHVMIGDDENIDLPLDLPNAYNPFVSESEEPYHALKYLFGLKSLYEPAALKPRYNQLGKPSFPYVGEILITLRGMNVVAGHHERHLLREFNGKTHVAPGREIGPELEATGFAWIPESQVKYCEVLKFPDFSGKYKSAYQAKFGLSKSLFNVIKVQLKKTTPGDNNRRDVERTLIEWLCCYHTVRLMKKAIDLADTSTLRFLKSDHTLTSDTPGSQMKTNDKDAVAFRDELALKLKEDVTDSNLIFKKKLAGKSNLKLYDISEEMIKSAGKSLGKSVAEIQGYIDSEDKLRTPFSKPRQARTPLKSMSDEKARPARYSYSPLRHSALFKEKEEAFPKHPGLELTTVPGDGSCLFHANALCLNCGQQDLRNLAADYMENNLESFIPYFEGSAEKLAAHIGLIKSTNECGDDPDISALAFSLNRTIVVIQSDKTSHFYNKEDGVVEPIFLYYTLPEDELCVGHYDALKILEGYSAVDIYAELFPGEAPALN
jgi:hypothetical protein